MRQIGFGLSVLLVGCDSDQLTTGPQETQKMILQRNLESRLAFTCVHEKFPEVAPDADRLFKYGRWLQKNNQLAQDETIYPEIERLYRIAAEHGHYKANINLQNGTRTGMFKVSGHDRLRFSQDLIDAGVASGYFLMATYLQRGLSTLTQDPEAALQYFRKAADEGSGQAQEYVGEKLLKTGLAWESAWAMRRCAAEQGIGEAATMVGINLQGTQEYDQAMRFFQLGAASGNEFSAGFLRSGFKGPPPTHELDYLGQTQDLERADRYDKIWRILANYSYAKPKVPEINDIVPLPPAPLPEWDGKLQWLEERLANIPPEKPSEELIKRLADEKLLEPSTGKPMPGSASFDASGFPLKACYSGDVCPQTGYWQIMWLPYEARHQVDLRVTRHLKEGEVMPIHVAERYLVRHWPFPDKRTFTEEVVHWGLLS
ncbi:DUF6396 domain-containing protein [Pseudomonas sp. dw_358]|uniref:SEL1-like repeat protein n=1 Tax=Pseudomonas sp. dw_358 TaxID=2720083 RepID=UPI001BD4F7A5|nr:DUF6396 domain-containing protein [Pseudomonas sp. dw_358]